MICTPIVYYPGTRRILPEAVITSSGTGRTSYPPRIWPPGVPEHPDNRHERVTSVVAHEKKKKSPAVDDA